MHPKTKNEITTIKLKLLLPTPLTLDARLFFKSSGALYYYVKGTFKSVFNFGLFPQWVGCDGV